VSDIYDNLSRNLRSLSIEKCSSVRQACKEMGINRQQFARYLNKKRKPRQSTLKKIADFFEVEISDLFREVNDRLEALKVQSRHMLRDSEFLSLITQINQMPTPSIEDGSYITYIRTPSLKSFVYRSVTIISSRNGNKYFRRLSGYGEKKGSFFELSLGHHRGMIINSRSHLFFVALDKLRSQSPSLLSMQWMATKKSMLKGTGIMFTPHGSEVCPIVMERYGAVAEWKNAIADSQVVGINEHLIPSHVGKIFSDFPAC